MSSEYHDLVVRSSNQPGDGQFRSIPCMILLQASNDVGVSIDIPGAIR